ncbi:MAG TPA: ABC transporter substrate-binding protein [Burkholderiales bacterium]|jgi:putative ABC transport system substrate-binding protein|nr:ABC transporter substrate-binding protein [Burkholderiales bacterium]
MNAIRRRQFLLTALGAVALGARAQTARRTYTVGILSLSSRAGVERYLQDFREALRDEGFAEGRDVKFEYRYGDHDFRKVERLAADLVRLNVDVIFAPSTWAVHGAKAATSTIPIVFTNVNDPVVVKFVESLAKPGRNITGVSIASVELTGKRLQLLKDTFPSAKRIGVLYNEEMFRACRTEMNDIDKLGSQVGLEVQRVPYVDRSDIVKAFESAGSAGVQALLIPATTSYPEYSSDVVLLSASGKMPTIYEHREAVEGGGLMSYGPDFHWAYRRAAHYVARILKGAKPAELPVERPTRYDLIVNLKTARAFGIKIPATILVRADRVIE